MVVLFFGVVNSFHVDLILILLTVGSVCLPVLQSDPPYPAAHVHVPGLPATVHVPPFAQVGVQTRAEIKSANISSLLIVIMILKWLFSLRLLVCTFKVNIIQVFFFLTFSLVDISCENTINS